MLTGAECSKIQATAHEYKHSCEYEITVLNELFYGEIIMNDYIHYYYVSRQQLQSGFLCYSCLDNEGYMKSFLYMVKSK